jgi:lysozyme family protein
MSNFEFAIPIILKHEGGYVNHGNDPGGPTNFGISLRYLKSIGDLNGDGVLEGDLDLDGDIDIEDIRSMTPLQARDFYFRHWWVRYEYGRIDDQHIATKVFSLSINMGSKQAHKLIQRATWAIKGYDDIPDDGILGKLSFAVINELPQDTLLAAYKSEAAGFYRALVAESKYKRPVKSKEDFLEGWLRRAYS